MALYVCRFDDLIQSKDGIYNGLMIDAIVGGAHRLSQSLRPSLMHPLRHLIHATYSINICV
jgi:hypothetical protein